MQSDLHNRGNELVLELKTDYDDGENRSERVEKNVGDGDKLGFFDMNRMRIV